MIARLVKVGPEAGSIAAWLETADLTEDGAYEVATITTTGVPVAECDLRDRLVELRAAVAQLVKDARLVQT